MNIYAVIAIVSAILVGGVIWYIKSRDEDDEDKGIDWSFLMGLSTDYCLLGHGNWEAHLELLSDYNFNMIKVFLQCGWVGDVSGSDFRLYNGSDPNNINQANLNSFVNFVNLANSKGIIVMATLFVTNGGAFGNGMTHNKTATNYRNYIETVARAVAGKGVILDILNEEANTAFIASANDIIKKINPSIRTNGYKVGGCDYISYHKADKVFNSGANGIQSNDTAPAILSLSDDDYRNVTIGAKNGGKGVEWLLAWARDNSGYIGNDIGRIKAQYGGMLGKLKQIREDV